MNEVKQNSAKAWFLAARPKTLTGAAVPVMIALAMAAHDSEYHVTWLPALLCLLFAFIMQIDANFVNDFFDWRRGNDDEATRLGPLRACSQGWVTPKAMVKALAITTVLASIVGLPLVFYGGWEMIFVGVACVACSVLYTTTLSYLALGDVLVLLFFGIVPICFSYYIQTHEITMRVFLMSLLCGIVIDNLLIVNNYRDIDNDRRDGKKTLIVLLGKKTGLALYLCFGLIAAVGVFFISNGTALNLVMIAYVALHCLTFMRMRKLKGKELNIVLGDTARNIFVFGMLASVVLLLS